MRIKLVLALLLVSTVAFGQGVPKSKPVLSSEITQQLPDGILGLIAPSVMRGLLNDLLASWQQYAAVNPQAGITYAVALSDYGNWVNLNNAAPVAVTIPAASGSFATFNTFLRNVGAGTVTVTPGVPSTICGGATLALTTNQSAWITSDGTNYQCLFFVSDSNPVAYPLAVNKGGTGGASASGTLVDNISGFASTGFLTRTGAGTYAFQSTTNGLTLPNIAQIPANTVLGNNTASPANVTALTGGQLSANLCLPQRTVAITGSNTTYSTPTCNGVLPTYLEIEMVGGGGGGAGSGTAAGTAATAGTASCWKTSGTACSSPDFTANGGGNGSVAGTTTNSVGGTAVGCDLGITGGGASGSNAATAVNQKGVDGADSFFGGRGIGPYNNGSNATAAATNSGSGGGGGGGNTSTPLEPGGGGAAGGYCRKLVMPVAASYVYTVGTHGNGGGSGASGNAGAAGADGVIIITAKWQ